MNKQELKHFGMGGLTLVPMDEPASSLFHHGVKGMKWGVRRYQNADGSLTKAGQKRVAKDITKEYKKSFDSGNKNIDKNESIQKARDAIKPERDAYSAASKKLYSIKADFYKDKTKREKFLKKVYDNKKEYAEKIEKENPDHPALSQLNSEYKKALLSEAGTRESQLGVLALREYIKSDKSFEKKYNEAQTSFRKARNDLGEAASKYIDAFLGDTGDKLVKSPTYDSNGKKTGKTFVSANRILETSIGELSFPWE